MAETGIQPKADLTKIKDIFQNCSRIFSELGFTQNTVVTPSEDRQIIFENQIIKGNSSLSLTVVALREAGKTKSQTYNFEFRNFPGNSSCVKLQERDVDSVKIQLVETENYQMLSMQLYFVIPLYYTNQDLVFRVRVDKSSNGSKIKLGFPWLEPKLHMSQDAAAEISREICNIFKTNEE